MVFTIVQDGDFENERAKLDSQIYDLIEQAYKTIKPEYAAVLFFDEKSGDTKLYAPEAHRAHVEGDDRLLEFGRRLFSSDELSDAEICLDAHSHDPVLSEGRATAFCGTKVFAKEEIPCGVFIASKPGRRNWSESKRQSLEFLAGALSVLLELNDTIFQLHGLSNENRKTQSELVAIEEQFAALARNVPGAIFRYIVSPSGEFRVESMSPGCVNIWGISAEDAEANPKLLWKSVIAEDYQAVCASMQQAQDQRVPWQHRWRIRCKQGFLRWLQGYGMPYDTPTGDIAWNTLILDVTVEQEAQISLAQNTRLLHEAQKLESIGRLAGGVAHDFNNLLSVIMGNAEALKIAASSAEDQDSVNEIVEATQRGAVLVKQLLSFARKSDLRVNVADIHTVLAGVDRLIRRVLPANISIEIIQRAGLWPVNIDHSMFENALLNVVINARDAMPEGGALTIETSNVRIDEEYVEDRDEDVVPGRYVMVAVTDTGVGIEEAVLPYVFDPFFSTKGPTHGTGLGLSMVQGFVKQSGGLIRVYSEPGHGTSIKMYFPALQDALELRDGYDSGAPRPERRTSTILLVEDQDAVRRTIEKVLLSAGYTVISANSGDEAIGIYQSRSDEIDIVLTDVVMPGKIQGPQLVRLARKINNSLPALYMSGYPHEANVHGNGIRAGDMSLMKPVRRNDILTAVAKLRRQL